jgi:hypothetical protein
MHTAIPLPVPCKRAPWNKGRLIGQKRPLKPKDVWAIRVRLQLQGAACGFAGTGRVSAIARPYFHSRRSQVKPTPKLKIIIPIKIHTTSGRRHSGGQIGSRRRTRHGIDHGQTSCITGRLSRSKPANTATTAPPPSSAHATSTLLSSELGRAAPQELGLFFGPQQDVGVVEAGLSHGRGPLAMWPGQTRLRLIPGRPRERWSRPRADAA